MHDLADVALRSLCVYLFMILGIRLFGKNQLSQLNTGDVVLLLLISNAVQNAMVGSDTSLLGGLTAAFVLFAANYILKKYAFKNPKIKNIIEDHPYILIRNGKTFPEILKKLNISDDELLETVHEHGVENIKEVKLAIFEVDGNISVISENKPDTKHILKPRKFPSKVQISN